ncbi:hypothetical protein GCM10008940_33810 [Microbulbifer agarilyticus]
MNLNSTRLNKDEIQKQGALWGANTSKSAGKKNAYKVTKVTCWWLGGWARCE